MPLAIPPPTDRGRKIPGIEQLARPAIRLHPQPGAPTVRDSHIGGPISWPADELWPHCSTAHRDDDGEPLQVALVVAAQLFRRDYPSLPFPSGRDLLQVLLCPSVYGWHEHYGTSYLEDERGLAVRLVWRNSAWLPEGSFDPPTPIIADEDHLPRHACVLRSCEVVEYPHHWELPDEIRHTLSFLDKRGNTIGDNEWPDLRWGSKIGGWTPWWQAGPQTFSCGDCGSDLRLLLSLHTDERPDDLCSCPSEHEEWQPVGWIFGREGALNIFTCPADVTHGIRTLVD